MKKHLLPTAFCLGLFFSSFSQNQNEYLVTQRAKSGTPAFIQFENSAGINHENFIEKLKDEFNFRPVDGFELVKESADKKGFKHFKLNQTYKKIIVTGSQYIIHEKDGIAQSANGKYFANLNINTEPTISKEAAIDAAKKNIGFKKYRWEDKNSEDALKKKSKNPSATNYPNPIIVIAPLKGDYKLADFRLCYKFNVSGMKQDEEWIMFIDAHTGEVVNKINAINSNDVTSNLNTYFYGPQQMKTWYEPSDGNYYLAEFETRGPSASQAIVDYSFYNQTAWSGASLISDNGGTFAADPVSVGAHWGIEKTYDFYYSNWSRDSYDNAGSFINVASHYDNAYANAFWRSSDSTMFFGDGDGTVETSQSAVDVCGHELSHAYINFSSNLVYQGESGALNESFADIFGTGVEFYVFGSTANWLFSEDTFISPGDYTRSLSNPKSKTQPDTYLGTYWALTGSGDPDQGGVHTNSGVQNYWFYLLSVGGNGNNDNLDNYSVAGIGINDALDITYRNETVYLTSSSDYNEVMLGSIQAAIDLFGTSSQQVQSVKDAWCAVGVGSCLTTTLNELQNNLTVSLFPNPTSKSVSIFNNHLNEEISVNIYNSLGQLVITSKFAKNGGIITIDLNSIPSGVYTVVTSSKNQSNVQKLILTK